MCGVFKATPSQSQKAVAFPGFFTFSGVIYWPPHTSYFLSIAYSEMTCHVSLQLPWQKAWHLCFQPLWKPAALEGYLIRNNWEKPSFLVAMTEESWQKCYLIQSLANCSGIRHQESYRLENVAQWCRMRPWIQFLAMWKMWMTGQVFQTKETYKLKTWAIQWHLELKVVWQIWANCSVFNAGRPGWRSHPGRLYKSAKMILRSPEISGW